MEIFCYEYSIGTNRLVVTTINMEDFDAKHYRKQRGLHNLFVKKSDLDKIHVVNKLYSMYSLSATNTEWFLQSVAKLLEAEKCEYLLKVEHCTKHLCNLQQVEVVRRVL